MPKLTIDGMEITVEPGTSIIQAAEQLGIDVELETEKGAGTLPLDMAPTSFQLCVNIL